MMQYFRNFLLKVIIGENRELPIMKAVNIFKIHIFGNKKIIEGNGKRRQNKESYLRMKWYDLETNWIYDSYLE